MSSSMPEETTPLLPGDASDAAPTQDPERVEDGSPTVQTPTDDFPDYFSRRIRLLTRCALICAFISAIVLLAAFITLESGPFYQYYSGGTNFALGGLMVCAFILAFINTRWSSFPRGLNAIADFFVAVYSLNYAADMLRFGWPSQSWCSVPRGGHSGQCGGWLIAVEVLMGVGVGLGIIVGLAHVMMLILRCIAIFRSGLFSPQIVSRPLGTGLRFPTGELTFQFTIKLLKQEDSVPTQVVEEAPTARSEAV